MEPFAVATLLVSIPLFLAATFFGTRWLSRRVLEHHEGRQHIADPVDREGLTVVLTLLSRPSSQRSNHEFVEYSMAVPGVTLSLVDGEALHLRTEHVSPRAEIGEPGDLETGDDELDNVFGTTRPLTEPDRDLLAHREVRRLLVELRQTYSRGVWIDHGTIRVVEPERPTEEQIDINVEYLTGVGTQLRALAATAKADT